LKIPLDLSNTVIGKDLLIAEIQQLLVIKEMSLNSKRNNNNNDKKLTQKEEEKTSRYCSKKLEVISRGATAQQQRGEERNQITDLN
jgi:hypothetical protein